MYCLKKIRKSLKVTNFVELVEVVTSLGSIIISMEVGIYLFESRQNF